MCDSWWRFAGSPRLLAVLSQLEAAGRINPLFSAKRLQRSALHFECREAGDDGGVKAWRGLSGQAEFELMKQNGMLWFRLGVARHGQRSAIGSGKRNIQHLNGSQFPQHRSRS